MAAEARATTATAVAEDDDDAIDDFIISVLFDRETRLAFVDSRVEEGIHRSTLKWYSLSSRGMRRKWSWSLGGRPAAVSTQGHCARGLYRCVHSQDGAYLEDDRRIDDLIPVLLNVMHRRIRR
jgi:hypothetical protein